MRIRRLLLFVTIALFCWIPWAQADTTLLPQLDVRVVAAPGFVTEPGEVELQFTFENKGSTPLTEISLTAPDGLSTQTVSDIEADSYCTCTLSHYVTEAELSAGKVSYLISCSAGEKKYSFTVDATIGRAEPDTPVEFLRNVVSRFAPSDGRITVVYQVINQSSTAITNVTVTDAMDGYSETIERIESGESVNLVHTLTVTDMIVSAPTLSYERNDAYATIQLSDLALRVAHPSMSMQFSLEPLSDGGVRVTLRLTNTGDVDFRSLAVYDDLYGGLIADGLRLTISGASVEVTKDYPARSGESYRWCIRGEDASGEAFQQTTETLNAGTETDNPAISLTLSAEPEWSKIKTAGRVPVTFTVSSTGFIQNLRISESALGDIFTLACVDGSQDTVFTKSIAVSESREYNFSVSYTDADGNEQTVSAEPVSIHIGSGGAEPDALNAHAHTPFSGTVAKEQHSKWYVFALIGAVLVLIALCAALITLSRRTHREAKEFKPQAGRESAKASFASLKRLTDKNRGKDDVSGIQ